MAQSLPNRIKQGKYSIKFFMGHGKMNLPQHPNVSMGYDMLYNNRLF